MHSSGNLTANMRHLQQRAIYFGLGAGIGLSIISTCGRLMNHTLWDLASSLLHPLTISPLSPDKTHLWRAKFTTTTLLFTGKRGPNSNFSTQKLTSKQHLISSSSVQMGTRTCKVTCFGSFLAQCQEITQPFSDCCQTFEWPDVSM